MRQKPIGLFSRVAMTLLLSVLTTATAWAQNFTDDGNNTYTIHNADGWDAFCSALQDNDTYDRFSGKTVKLADNITVTSMAGSGNHDFCGTFDGQGHKLTVNYGSSSSPLSEENAAPFLFAESGCVIKNLHVDGDIYTSAKYAAGIIAAQYGTVTIENCRVSVNIHSTVAGDGTHGGLVATNNKSSNLTIKGCVFDGKLLTTTGTNSCGGFVGWRAGTANIYNSLFAPAQVTVGTKGSATFARNDIDTYNCYFTNLLNDGSSYAPTLVDGSVTPKKYRNGQRGYSVATNSHVVIAHTGEATVYDVSGITVYDKETGMEYQNTFYAAQGETLTLQMEAGYASSSAPTVTGASVTASGSGPWTLTIPAANITVTTNYSFDPTHFTQSGDTYTILTPTGWDVFCNCLDENATYNRFSGKTVYLGADITVSRKAGYDSHDFCGTFDGQRHTLTFNYGTAKEPTTEQFVAPFCYISTITTSNVEAPATIRNLHVAGDIYTSAKYAAGIVGRHWNTVNIENCRSSITIHSSLSGDGTHGGFSAVQSSGTLNISGCLFDGKLLTTNSTSKCSGFVGWGGGTVNITNSIYAPANAASGETWAGNTGSATFCRNGATINNCYYTTDFNDGTNYAKQGQQMHSIMPGEHVILGFNGTATTHNVSNITAYTLSGNTLNPGLKYGDTYYSGDNNTVSLTLAAESGHTFVGYSANGGILTSSGGAYTLAMPNADVTINGIVPCPVPTDVIISNITANTAVVSWTSDAESFNLMLGEQLISNISPSGGQGAYTLTGLAANTAYTVKVQAVCGQGNSSEWTSGTSFTTLENAPAVCPVPTNVTISNITANTAVVSWTSDAEGFNLMLGEQLITNIPPLGDQGAYTLTGLTANTTYTVKVQAVCGQGSSSEWTSGTSFTTPQGSDEGVVSIGEGTSSDKYLPTYSIYNNALTQQIYTAQEIGKTGQIASISFKNTGGEKTRNIDLYLVHTDKASFSGSSDWISVTASDLVFSGSVTFIQGEWTTIDLTTPFSYNGTSNLAVVIDDNTGSYSFGFSCLVYNATSQAIRKFSDDTNFDPTNPSSYSGTVMDVKNQIKLEFRNKTIIPKPTDLSLTLTPGDVTKATLSWTENGTATAWEISLLSGSAAETIVNADTNPFTLTGLTPDVSYTAKVRAVAVNSASGWSKTVSFEPTTKTVIGTATATNSYVPASNYYMYGLTEQIYTAAEIGSQTGHILSIDFYKASTIEMVKDLDIYIVDTDKTGFTSKTDWIPVTASDHVFNGTVTFADNAWTTINLNVPFYYDGQSNICIVVDDNTGDYKSSTPFRVFDASTNQTLYYLSDNYNLDPTTTISQTASDCINQKNCIRLVIGESSSVCSKPIGVTVSNVTKNAATITWTSDADAWQVQLGEGSIIDVAEKTYTFTGLNAGTPYTAKVRTYCSADNQSGWSKEVSFTTPCEAITVTASNTYSQGFEGYTGTTYNATNGVVPACWDSYATNGKYIAPHIIGSGSYCYVHEGTNALTFYGSGYCYAALPEFTNALSELQISFWMKTETPAYGELTLGYITAEDENFNTFTAIETYDRNSGSMVQRLTYLNNVPAAATQLVFRWYYQNQYSCCIDDVEVSLLPSCLKPTGLAIAEYSITRDGATINWTPGGSELSWRIEYATDADFTNPSYATVNDDEPTYTFHGLDASTTYYVRVQADCGNDGSEYSDAVSFTTLQIPVNVPYSNDFESDNDWLFVNGDRTNAWAWGTATSNGGERAIYVSKNGGTTNDYDNNSSTMVYATKAFNFNAGTYVFSYDWRANGEGSYDYLRVALVPSSVTPTPGTNVPSDFNSSSLPTGWIALDGGTKLNQESDWQSYESGEIDIATAGIYTMVFAWRNDNSMGDNPPAAIDNVSIEAVTCPAPTDLAYSQASITANSVELSWTENGNATAWEISVSSGSNPETIVRADTNPFTLTYLNSETEYTAKVRAYYDAENQSRWSEEIVFETASTCQTPDGLAATATSDEAVISWNGYGQATFNLHYTTDGETWTTMSKVANPCTLTGLSASTIYKVQVQPTCADADTWSASFVFITKCQAIANFPWSEGFEDGQPSSCWSQDGDGTWTVGTGDHVTSTGAHTGTYNALIDHRMNDDVTKLITPVLDLSSLNYPLLSFWYINRKYTADIDDLAVYYRTAPDAEWTLIDATEKAHETWTLAEYLLPNPSATYQIAFEMTDDWGFGIGIDDITIEESLVLADKESNGEVIGNNYGNTFNVVLNGRTLWKDGDWNTLCLPFSMNAGQVTAQLAPTELKELDTEHKWANVNGQWTVSESGQKTGLYDGTLYLNFKDADAISAGVPYIIKWNGDGTNNLVNPMFSHVTIDKNAPTEVTFNGGKFVGTYDYMTFGATNTSILFLGEDNTLYYPQSGASIGAFRAYFMLNDPNGVRAFRLNFGDDSETQGIMTTDYTDSTDKAGAWFDLQGRRVSESRIRNSGLKHGLYIHNGRKVVIK